MDEQVNAPFSVDNVKAKQYDSVVVAADPHGLRQRGTERLTKSKPQLPATLTYAEVIRMKMKTGDNPTKKPITTRQLAEALGVTYEHVRQILLGRPAMSRDLNEKLCEYMGVDADAMWQKLQTEKFQKKLGFRPNAPSEGGRLAELWPELTDANRAALEQMAEAMVATNKMMTKRVMHS
jgi:transcriptional regulator with XRE-family HTH domain